MKKFNCDVNVEEYVTACPVHGMDNASCINLVSIAVTEPCNFVEVLLTKEKALELANELINIANKIS